MAFDCLKAVPGGPYGVELAGCCSDGQHDHHCPGFLTRDGVPAYSGVELVEITA
ncbi:hypothetical protein [Streptomyces sp. NPDC002403]